MSFLSRLRPGSSKKPKLSGKVIAKFSGCTVRGGFSEWETIKEEMEQFVQMATERVKECPKCGKAPMCLIRSEDLSVVLKCPSCGQELPIITKIETEGGLAFSVTEVSESGKRCKLHVLTIHLTPGMFQGGEL